LKPLGDPPPQVRDCRLTRVRYRRAERCILQYTLRLEEAATGGERYQWVGGAIHADGRTERRWRRSRRRLDPLRAAREETVGFEPVTFIPELRMLAELFPYDRRLPALPALTGSSSPDLERRLLASLGSGAWQIETRACEPMRYRAQLGAVLRYAL